MSGLEELPPGRAGAAGDDAAGDPDLRVLHRVRPFVPGGGLDFQRGVACGCALDVEATGLEPGRHRIIQLAAQRFYVDAEGRICDVGVLREWYEDPGEPLSAEIVELTGITDADVRGRSIRDAEVASMFLDVDFLVAHNSTFDRPMVERRLPDAAGRPWVCSMRDVPWRRLGFEGASLSHLLLQTGFFYRAHSATTDVSALLRLLDHRLARTGRTVVTEALEGARRSDCVVSAPGAPFAARTVLRDRGYRWNAADAAWERTLAPAEAEAEERWLAAAVYRGTATPRRRVVDWTRRYA